jgi:hypothetical protein
VVKGTTYHGNKIYIYILLRTADFAVFLGIVLHWGERRVICITVTNTLDQSAVVFCVCEKIFHSIVYYVVRFAHKFGS